MGIYRKWVDEPWRDMSSAARGISIVVVIVAANLLSHAMGGNGGFIIGLIVAIVLAVLIPLCWQALQR